MLLLRDSWGEGRFSIGTSATRSPRSSTKSGTYHFHEVAIRYGGLFLKLPVPKGPEGQVLLEPSLFRGEGRVEACEP